MDLIARNPYRVLGVFADDTNKVRTANTGKIRAFLKVGKEIHFDIDVPNLLGPINRTQEMLDNAISLLSDETEATIQALFWFHLEDFGGSTALWYANCLNDAVRSLAKEDYDTAADSYLTFIDCYFQQFRKAVNFLPPPQGSTSDEQLVQLFIERLTAEYPDVDWWQHFSLSGKRAIPHYLKDIFEKIAIDKIKENIDNAKKEKIAKDTEWLRIAQRLRRSCIPHIKTLQPCIDKTIRQQSVLSQLPVDEQGNPDIEQAKDAGQAVDALIEDNEGSFEDAKENAESTLEYAKSELEKAQKAKPKAGASVAETMANIKARKEAIAAAQRKVDFWQAAVDEFKRREEAEKKSGAQESAEATSKGGQLELDLFDEAPNVLQLHKDNTISAEGQLVLDELCKELIRECKLYYKAAKSDNEESVLPTLQLVEYALSLASSNDVKEKATAFKKELDQDVQKLPPKEVKEEAQAIKKEIKAFCLKPDMIRYSIQLVRNCFPYLKSIRAKLGNDNAYYVDISTRIADDAMYNSVIELKPRSIPPFIKSISWEIETPLREAWELILYFQQMHLSEEFRKGKLQAHIATVQQELKQYEVKYSDITISASLLTDEELLIKRGDYASLVQFCKQHPDSPYAEAARQKIREIEIDAFPKQITIKSILAYKAKYPNTHKDATVLKWVDDFMPKADLWTTDDYKLLLKLYPNHKDRLKIQNRIAAIEDAFYEKCKSKEDYEEYLRKYPNGRHVVAAKDNIKELQSKEDLRYYLCFLLFLVIAIIIILAISSTDSHTEETTELRNPSMEGKAFEADDDISSEELECDEVESEEKESAEAYSSDNTTSTYDSLLEARQKEVEEWGENHLSTGATPYRSYFGNAQTGDNYLKFETKGDCDYVVIVKRASDDRYMNHIYIRGGDKATLYLPDGHYNVYFYSGKGWNPNKKVKSLIGGFVLKESPQKGNPIELESNELKIEYIEYTLYPVQNGNLRLKDVSMDELFGE